MSEASAGAGASLIVLRRIADRYPQIYGRREVLLGGAIAGAG